MRETRVNRSQHGQRAGNRPLTDAEIVGVRALRLLLRRHARAHAETHAQQREERAQFAFGERVCLVVPRGYSRRRGERIFSAQRHVRHRNRDVVHRVADHHVAEIEDTGDLLQRLIDQHVVVVRVGVDDAASERRQPRHDMRGVMAGDSRDVAAQHCVIHQREVGRDHIGGVGQVPVKCAVERRMIERGQRAIEAPHGPTDIASQCVGVERRRAERAAVERRDHPHHVGPMLGDVATVDGRDQLRREPCAGEVTHDCALSLEHFARFIRVGELEDEAFA